MEKVNILITGAGSVMGQSIYQALNYSRLAKNIGIVVINSNELGAAFYFNQKYPKLHLEKTHIVPIAANESYEETINNLVNKHMINVIFSGTQHEILKLSNYNLKNAIVAAIPPQVLMITLDKYKTAQFLMQNNIPMPKTWLFKDLSDSKELLFPLIIKPRSSSSSRNIYIIKNQVEFNEFSQKNIVKEQEFIIQEYIDGEEYTCGCYMDRYSKQLNIIILKRTLTADGATGYGEVINNKKIEMYVQKIYSALINEGWEYGHINVQLRDKDDQPSCFEINGRLSSTEGPKAALGFNSVDAYIHNIVLKKAYEGFNVQYGKKFLRYYDEVIF